MTGKAKGRLQSYEAALYASRHKNNNDSAKAAIKKFREIEDENYWPTIVSSRGEWTVHADHTPRDAVRRRKGYSGWHKLDFIFDRLKIIAVIASVLGATSVGWAVCPWLEGTPTKEFSIKVLSAFWTVMPAVYFFFEFHWARGTLSGPKFRDVKESQKVASKVWAGVVVALAVLYLKHGSETHVPPEATDMSRATQLPALQSRR